MINSEPKRVVLKKLTARCKRVFNLLYANKGNLVIHDELVSAMWPDVANTIGGKDNLFVTICGIRGCMENSGLKLITVRNHGYILEEENSNESN